MKILYLSKAILPSEISNSLSIMRMGQAFADNGHEVILTGIDPGGSNSDPTEYYGLRGGFKVYRKRLSKLMNNRLAHRLHMSGLSLAQATKHLVKDFKPDVLYSRLTLSELALLPKNIPIVYEMHSLGHLGGYFFDKSAFKLLVSRKNFTRIIVTTNALAELMSEMLPGVETVVARLSAEPPVTVESTELESFRKNQLQGSGFAHHAGYTGYLDTIGLRGTDIICKTAARMPDTAFHIVGGTPDTVAHWRQYAQAHNQHGNIFFYGFRNPAEIPLFLNCFDVALAPLQFNPSKRAPKGQGMSPLKIPQYLGYSKAIVASDIPAHREILQDEKNALLVKHDEPAKWSSAIQKLLDSPKLKNKICHQAYLDYMAEFTPEIRVKKILKGL